MYGYFSECFLKKRIFYLPTTLQSVILLSGRIMTSKMFSDFNVLASGKGTDVPLTN